MGRDDAGALAGRTALVTGGSRGIGRAIALRLAADGALVAVHHGHDREAAATAVEEIAAAGGRAFAIRAPFGGDDEDIGALFATLDRELAARTGTRRLDVLVNNAGIAPRATVESADRELLDELHAVNVRAPFLVAQRALERMPDGGRIVNVSSGVVRIAMPEITPYAMTKAALESLSLQLAAHLGGRGITVNTVRPGVIDTDMNAGWLRADADARKRVLGMQAVKRIGRPEDVAAAVAFLASPGAGFCTGAVVEATGGAGL